MTLSWEQAEAEMMQRNLVTTLTISKLVATSRLWPAVLTARGVRQQRFQAANDMAKVDHADLSRSNQLDRGTLILNLRDVRTTTQHYLEGIAQEARDHHYSRIALLTGWPEFAVASLRIATGLYGLDFAVVRHLPYLLLEQP